MGGRGGNISWGVGNYSVGGGGVENYSFFGGGGESSSAGEVGPLLLRFHWGTV